MPNDWQPYIPAPTRQSSSTRTRGGGITDWQPYTPNQPKPMSWGNLGLNTVLRTGPPILGGLMFGPPGGGVGGGVGDVLGQAHEYLIGNRTEYNPYETVMNAGLGLVPPFFSKASTTLGAAARAGLEGLVINTAATPFQHAARTGSFDAPASEYGMNAATGLGFGTVLGGALHNLPATGPKPRLPGLPDPKVDIPGGGGGGTVIPPRPSDIQTSPITTPIPSGQLGDKSFAVLDAGNPIETILQSRPGRIVSYSWSAADREFAKRSGYVPAGATPDGMAYMLRSDLVPKSAPSVPATSQVKFTPGDDIVYPDNEVTDTIIRNLGREGYFLAEKAGGYSTFREGAETPNLRPPTVEPPLANPVARAQEALNTARQREMEIPSPIMEEPTTTPFVRQQTQLENISNAPQSESIDLGPTPPIVQEQAPLTIPARPAIQGESQFSPERVAVLQEAVANTEKAMGRPRHLLDKEGQQRFDQLARTELKRILAERASVRPQEMRVPNVREGNTGLENVAMGGASPRVLDVVGSSIYTRPGPITTIKELLQNAFDEHKQMGIQEPVRVLIDGVAPNPISSGGTAGKSITVRDRGRGVTPEQIYTVLTNLGETGKAGVESAAGGFGFAKAAPFLGGKYATITSVVDTPNGRMRYTFKGNPFELKNQAKGVALNAQKVSNDVPTGLEITTWYDADARGFWQVATWAKNMTERSPSVEGGILVAEDYGANPNQARRWLDETNANPILSTEHNWPKTNEQAYKAQSMPTLMDTIDVPGSKINIHYDIEPGLETSNVGVYLANKGMYQGTNELSYGDTTANVPRSIVADINAIVEEGHPDYPFSANREQINDDVTGAINKWIRDNIISGVTQKRIAEIQKMYDDILPLHPAGLTNMHYLDEGNLLTPAELHEISSHPLMVKALQAMEAVQRGMLDIADTLGWQPESYGATWTKPSERLKKFGLLFRAPSPDGTTLGIHIPRPDDLNNSSILINLFEHLNDANKHATPIDQLVTSLLTTIAHEDAHIPGGSHDKGHSYRDAELRSKFGGDKTVDWMDELGGHFDDGKGKLDPEILRLLQIYNESRARATGGTNDLLATGISRTGQPPTSGGTPGDITGTRPGQDQPPPVGPTFRKGKPKAPPSKLREWYNLPRGATTPLDLSASARQGLPLITRKEWWNAWIPQMKALGSEGAFQKSLADLQSKEIHQTYLDKRTGKMVRSLADRGGIKLMEATSELGSREEATASNWIETGQMFGKDNAVQGLYKKTVGRAVRASNRAYMAFLNQLRSDTFENLVGAAKAQFDAGVKGSRNPMADDAFLREIGDFVNTATGRGPLKIARPTYTEKGGFGLKESNFEQAAGILADGLFSPRLAVAHTRMLNPFTYAMASPFVRKQYLKALFSVAGAWGTVAGLAAGAGADVSMDPASADFGKIRMKNTRLDPAGGYQQYIVAAYRLLSGRFTSSATQTESELGQGYQARTRGDVIQTFAGNKLHPVLKFANDLAFASQYQPFHVTDRSIQLFIPLILQDTVELMREDPKLAALIGPVALGMGTQTYSKGESVAKFIPAEKDWIFGGGAPQNEMPDVFENLWEP